MGEHGMTDSERERLGKLSAEAMGFEPITNQRSGKGVGYKTPYGYMFGAGNSAAIEMWEPWADLNQAVMVAEKVGSVWSITKDNDGSYRAVVHRTRLTSGGFIVRPWVEAVSEQCPAEALLLACAKAMGWKWRDGESA